MSRLSVPRPVAFIARVFPHTVPPSIRGADRDVPDIVTVLVNKSLLLECHVDGSPAPKISWLKDGLLLNPDRTHTLLSGGRTLQVRRTERNFRKPETRRISPVRN